MYIYDVNDDIHVQTVITSNKKIEVKWENTFVVEYRIQ